MISQITTNNKIITLSLIILIINTKCLHDLTDKGPHFNCFKFTEKTIPNNEKCFIIIKYKNTYLPLLRVNTQNVFDVVNIYNLLENNNYEMINENYYINKIVEKKDVINSTTGAKSVKVDNAVVTDDKPPVETVMLYSLSDMKKIKRDDLQRIAVAYSVDIMKEGVRSRSKIKKTKQDLFNDFKTVVYNENIIIR